MNSFIDRLLVTTAAFVALTTSLRADEARAGFTAQDVRSSRAQAEKVARQTVSFARLHETSPGTVPAPQGEAVSLGLALSAYGAVADAFDYSGNGDVNYWMRTAADFGRSARSLGVQLVDLANAVGPGPVGAVLRSSGTQLAAVSWAGSGDVYYWLARTRGIADQVLAVGAQLGALGASVGPEGGYVSLGSVLRGLAAVARSVDYSGRGNVDYWMRVTRNFGLIAHGVGHGLFFITQGLQGPYAAVVSSLSSQFGSVSSAGYGDVNYWMARAQGVAEQMRGYAGTLESLVQ